MDKTPLVSVVVVTYNSCRTIIETLNSIYLQTYNNLELIITDDKSSDNTLELCKHWIKQHQDRFIRCEVKETEFNTGTAGNCNRGCHAAKGEWIKIIAGDDLLLESGIESLVGFASQDDNIKIVCGRVEIFGEVQKNYDNMTWNHNQKLPLILNSADEQYWYLVRRNFIPAMAVMMKKSLWLSVGGFDEDIPLLEDWPMWLLITASGEMIHFTEEIVAKYRLSRKSVRLNRRFLYSVRLFQYKYVYHDMKKFGCLCKMPFLQRQNFITNCIFRIINWDIRKRGL